MEALRLDVLMSEIQEHLAYQGLDDAMVEAIDDHRLMITLPSDGR